MVDRATLHSVKKSGGWRRGQRDEEKVTIGSRLLTLLVLGLVGAVVGVALPFLFMAFAASRGSTTGESPSWVECVNPGFILGCAAFFVVIGIVGQALNRRRGRW